MPYPIHPTTIAQDIHVFTLTAEKFPIAVPDTFKQLHARITSNADHRRYFGISCPNEAGDIVYKAAAEVLEPGEAAQYGCESFTIKQGTYASIAIKNHGDDPQSIGNAFQQLIHLPDIDPQGYCLEVYANYTDPDVVCLVGLK